MPKTLDSVAKYLPRAGGRARARVRIYRPRPEFAAVVILSEYEGDTDREELVDTVLGAFRDSTTAHRVGWLEGPPPTWIEHDPANPEPFHLILVEDGAILGPSASIDRDAVEELIGEELDPPAGSGGELEGP